MMASRLRHVTKKEYRKIFNESLTAAIELGRRPNMSSGLTGDVLDAITAVATVYPKTDEQLIAYAKRTFADLMDRLSS